MPTRNTRTFISSGAEIDGSGRSTNRTVLVPGTTEMAFIFSCLLGLALLGCELFLIKHGGISHIFIRPHAFSVHLEGRHRFEGRAVVVATERVSAPRWQRKEVICRRRWRQTALPTPRIGWQACLPS